VTPREWDAATYDRVSRPQLEWGRAVLERLALRGDERVLDAGCGSGRVTAELVRRLPQGQVVAVDASAAMVARAREALPPNVRVVQADLLALELDEPVDAVFSTATFHWILDHGRLFDRLHALLRPGGRLVAQCGGAGNLSSFLAIAERVGAAAPYAEHLAGMGREWRFASPQDTAALLERAGFADVRCWLSDGTVVPPDPPAFIRAAGPVSPHVARLPEPLREPFVADVVARLGEPARLDYVRLNLDARRVVA
jgi:trans-aconitate 2-methyltransferase